MALDGITQEELASFLVSGIDLAALDKDLEATLGQYPTEEPTWMEINTLLLKFDSYFRDYIGKVRLDEFTLGEGINSRAPFELGAFNYLREGLNRLISESEKYVHDSPELLSTYNNAKKVSNAFDKIYDILGEVTSGSYLQFETFDEFKMQRNRLNADIKTLQMIIDEDIFLQRSDNKTYQMGYHTTVLLNKQAIILAANMLAVSMNNEIISPSQMRTMITRFLLPNLVNYVEEIQRSDNQNFSGFLTGELYSLLKDYDMASLGLSKSILSKYNGALENYRFIVEQK